ncbi:MAG: DUF4912 domain-containing protein [Planctomycetes bacterium]|nr:DUF4912 domain-containing protein [Planctomycetota bacterium]
MAKKRKPAAGKKNYSVKELRQMASDRKVPGRSKMNKSQLLDALGLSDTVAVAPPPAPTPAARKAVAKIAEHVAAQPPASAPPEAPAKSDGVFIDWGPDIPRAYGQDVISLVVKDPEWLFATWELTGPLSRSTRERIGQDAVLALRIERLDGAFADIRPGDSSDWYLSVTPGMVYRAIIGFLDRDGVFVPVAASRTVKTPRVGLSDSVDAKWMIVRQRIDELLRYLGGLPASGSMFAIEAGNWRIVKLAWSGTNLQKNP